MEDHNAVRIALTKEGQGFRTEVKQEEMEDRFNQEIRLVMEDMEDYDCSKAMTQIYRKSLEKSLYDKILDTVPDYVFHDIKKPLQMENVQTRNPINPFRRVPYNDFFDQVNHENWHKRTRENRNHESQNSMYRMF
jgi:hypothetical protein